MGQRRYPGATPFTKDQAKIFYGRNTDIRNLLTMVRVEQKVLLYSKSGLGKTSLLEAGVIPRLPKNYTPVSIRFYAKRTDSLSPAEGVLTALENTLGKMEDMPPRALDELETSERDRKTLWYYFKKLQLAQAIKAEEEPDDPDTDDDENDDEEVEAKLPKTYVLVFDQFEELFSYSKAEIDDFKQQFYELTEQNVPERYAELIAPARRKNREKFNRRTLGELHRKTNVKIVFAIRSDRLSLLNQLSDKITDIQQIFYEIKPLTNNQAQEAIINPAKDTSEGFDTSPYKFHQDAISKIIHELTKKETGSENIETTQLQIVCHRIEDIAQQKKMGQSGSDQVEIQVKDLPNFKNIFLDFYEDSIQRLQEASRDKAKRMIEDELIRSKQRISLDENICREFLTGEELKLLVDTHLLRSERNSFGRFSFELSHDTLVEPILESQKKFKDKQERVRLAQKEKTRQTKLRRQRVISLTFAVSFLISLILLWVAYNSYNEAEAQKKVAIENQQEAKDNLIKFKNAQFQDFFENGNDAMSDADYDVAIANYKLAKRWISADIPVQINDSIKGSNIFSMFTGVFANLINSDHNPNKTTRNNATDDIYYKFDAAKRVYDSLFIEIEQINQGSGKLNIAEENIRLKSLEQSFQESEKIIIDICSKFLDMNPVNNAAENVNSPNNSTVQKQQYENCLDKADVINDTIKLNTLCKSCNRVKYINDSIGRCFELKATSTEYRSLLADAASLRKSHQFKSALNKYSLAYKMDNNRTESPEQFKITKKEAKDHYNMLIRIARGIPDEVRIASAQNSLREIQAMEIDK